MNNHITLPPDWEAPTLAFGQEVAVRKSGYEDYITGIRLDTIDEGDIPPYDVWMYRVGARWYNADQIVNMDELKA